MRERLPTPLRPVSRGDWLPGVAAWLAALVGAVNLVSALGAELPERLRALAGFAPPELTVGAHALTLPAGVALLGAAVFLRGRRRRAQRVAVLLLVALGVLDLLRGLDIEEALLSWGLAGLLVWGRDAFRVQHDDEALPRALRHAALLVGGAVVLAVGAVAGAHHWASPDPSPIAVVREALGQLALVGGPLRFSGAATFLPHALQLLGLLTAALAASELLRPLRASLAPCPRLDRAAAIVRSHGEDTLSCFKLREDLPRRFSDDGRAFVAYRVDCGVMLLSGDPVGPVDALDDLLADVCAFADEHGLRVACLGATERFSERAGAAGLKRLYIGDEAIVDTATFSLEGRPIRKVRQAVTRLRKADYTVALRRVGDLSVAEIAELEALSARWRNGQPERGFSMAMDRLVNPELDDARVVVATDASGTARGFLHFVPSYGRPALSLGFMRRDRDTPNGLSEYLIVEAIALTRAAGIEELSLNFAAFARYLREPEGRRQRLIGWLARRGDGQFQIESLYRFNAKFFPRWQPRYLLFDGVSSLPRTAIAALRSEGQMPLASPPGSPGVRERLRAARA